MAIVEERVKPARLVQNDVGAKERWWQFIRIRPELHAAIASLARVLAVASHSPHLAFGFLRAGAVYSHALIVFPLTTYGAFCALQSRPHETWARFFGSSIKDDLRYTASDCFETFPFPGDWRTDSALERGGAAYYEFRAALMVARNEGLTAIYNRFHDPEVRDPDVARLRELHAGMDRAVLDAYGWDDISTGCEFTLDYEVDEDESGRRRKPWRYRWPDEVRDEVLARLIDLNGKRAAQERRSGAAASGGRRGGRRPAAAPQAERLT